MPLFVFSCTGNRTPGNGFTETIVPQTQEELLKLNYSKNEFSVSVKDGVLEVRKYSGRRGPMTLDLPDGKIVAEGRGEFGGYVEFIQNGKVKKSIRLDTGNVSSLFMFEGEVYFTQGLRHLSLNFGSLCRLKIQDGSLEPETALKFSDAPAVAAVYKGAIYAVTASGFSVIKDFKERAVFKDMFWGYLYPNSIAVIDDENIFIGMRSGIVKINLLKDDFTYFKYAAGEFGEMRNAPVKSPKPDAETCAEN